MSQNILLVQYNSDENGNIYEAGCCTIESAFINPALLQKIEESYPLKDVEVFESVGSSESSLMDCFDSDSTEDIQLFLENEFISLLNYEYVQNNKELIVRTDLYNIIDGFRTITNLINVFRLKNEKYRHSFSVVVKLG